MSDHRTHSAHSAIDDEMPLSGMTSEEIRNSSIAAGREVRAVVDELPDSPCKTEFLRIQSELEAFWRDTATPSFCHQWLIVALKVGS